MEDEIKCDPVEKTEKYKQIEKEVDALAEKMAEEIVPKNYDGFCYAFWNAKKAILKEKYNIEWKSPAELNKDILFD